MLISFMIEKIGQVLQFRRSQRELSGLSDRELWDIGLVRTDVEDSADSTS